jgi:GMP synthase PP-ATPase subunit
MNTSYKSSQMNHLPLRNSPISGNQRSTKSYHIMIQWVHSLDAMAADSMGRFISFSPTF